MLDKIRQDFSFEAKLQTGNLLKPAWVLVLFSIVSFFSIVLFIGNLG